jgi:hypothetical protein
MAEIVQVFENKMKAPHSIQVSEFRESRAHESDPQDCFSQTLLRNTIPLGRRATIGPAQVPLDPPAIHPLRFSMAGSLP